MSAIDAMRSSRPRRTRTAIAAVAVAVIGTLLCTPAASAAWSRPLTASGTIALGSVSVQIPSLSSSSSTLSNTVYQSTHAVVVRNTQASTSFTGTSSVIVHVDAGPAPAPLSSAMNVTVWPVASVAACTQSTVPPGGSPSGLWASGVSSMPVALVRDQEAVFCIRGSAVGAPSTVTDPNQNRSVVAATLGAPGGSMTFVPRVQAAIALESFIATTAATATAFPVATSQIHPFEVVAPANSYYQVRPTDNPAYCLDVTGGYFSLPGTLVGTYPCHPSTTDPGFGNQFVSMLPIAGTNAVSLRFRMNDSSNGYLQAGGTTPGAAIAIQTSGSANLLQRWIPQRVNGTTTPAVFQLVNAASGLCLTSVTATAQLTLAACDGGAAQRFSWTQIGVAFP